MTNHTKAQPQPIAWANEHAIWPQVIEDMKTRDEPKVTVLVMDDMVSRDEFGRETYGVPLQAHNGRSPLVDAYQECLDQAVYLKQALIESEPIMLFTCHGSDRLYKSAESLLECEGDKATGVRQAWFIAANGNYFELTSPRPKRLSA